MPETPVSAIDQRNFWLVLACLKKTLRSIISKRSKYREALESRIKFEIKVLNKWEPDFRKSEWWQLQWDDWTFWLSDTAFTELFLGFDFLLLSFSRIHLHSSWHCFFWQEPHFLSPLLALERSSKRERREPFNGWDAVFPLWNVTDWRKKWGQFSMKNLKKMSRLTDFIPLTCLPCLQSDQLDVSTLYHLVFFQRFSLLFPKSDRARRGSFQSVRVERLTGNSYPL